MHGYMSEFTSAVAHLDRNMSTNLIMNEDTSDIDNTYSIQHL